MGIWCVLAVVLPVPHAWAEEISVMAGATRTDDNLGSSYSWQFDYRQRLFSNLGASLGYVNEGHLTDHHRDGIAPQFWAVTPRWRERLEFALGAGPYIYFDTQPTDSPPWFRNRHGVGEIYTGSLTLLAGTHWYARANFSIIHAPGDIDTRTLVIGGGYRLDDLFSRAGAAFTESATAAGLPLNEVNAFAGQTVVNGNSSGKSSTFGAEYRRDVAGPFEVSLAWLNEAVGLGARHNGLLIEAWLVTPAFDPRFSIGVGAGPDISLQSYLTEDGREAGTVTGMVSISVAWRFSRDLGVRLAWHRSVTADDQDRDVVTAGIGWSWGGP